MQDPFKGVAPDALQKMFRKRNPPVNKSEIISIAGRLDAIEESLDELKIILELEQTDGTGKTTSMVFTSTVNMRN